MYSISIKLALPFVFEISVQLAAPQLCTLELFRHPVFPVHVYPNSKIGFHTCHPLIQISLRSTTFFSLQHPPPNFAAAATADSRIDSSARNNYYMSDRQKRRQFAPLTPTIRRVVGATGGWGEQEGTCWPVGCHSLIAESLPLINGFEAGEATNCSRRIPDKGIRICDGTAGAIHFTK